MSQTLQSDRKCASLQDRLVLQTSVACVVATEFKNSSYSIYLHHAEGAMHICMYRVVTEMLVCTRLSQCINPTLSIRLAQYTGSVHVQSAITCTVVVFDKCRRSLHRINIIMATVIMHTSTVVLWYHKVTSKSLYRRHCTFW